jgi:hypothetical protein
VEARATAAQRAPQGAQRSGQRRTEAVSIRDFKIMSGLSNATIFRRIADGSLKSIKIHGRRLISFDEVERLREGAPV